MLDRRSVKLHADRQLRAALDALDPRVRGSLERLLRERSLLTPDPGPYFRPLGHPVFELPVWVAGRLREEGAVVPEDVLSDVLGVSALGYLRVRAQDDWLDSAARDDPGPVALAEALSALCTRLLVGVVGSSPRFWALHSEVLTAYAGSMLRSLELRAGSAPVGRDGFEELLAQSRPLVLPTAALLDRAGRWDLLGPLEEFVLTATAASQVVNDLTDVFRDAANGHRTWTLDVLGPPAPDRWWPGMAASGGGASEHLQDRVDQALAYHERSAVAVRALAGTAAGGWTTERRAALEGLSGSLRNSLLTAFVGRLTRSAGRADRVHDPREEPAL